MFVRAVVVAGYGACTDVYIRTNFGIADISQVIDLAVVRNGALFDFDKITDLHVVGKLGAGTQPSERPYLATVAGCRALNVAVTVNETVRTKFAVANEIVRFDKRSVTEFYVTLEDCVHIDEDIATAL